MGGVFNNQDPRPLYSSNESLFSAGRQLESVDELDVQDGYASMMNQVTHSSLPRVLTRIASISLIIFYMIQTPRDLLAGHPSVIQIVFEVGLAGVCLVVAYQGWFCRTPRSVRWLCGLAAFSMLGFLIGWMDKVGVGITGFPLLETTP